MNHRKADLVNLKSILKNIFFIKPPDTSISLIPKSQTIEKESHDYSDYISFYQQATRWK